MKPRNAALLVIVVIVVASIGLYASYPRIVSTRIAGITADPRSFDGKEVNIFGTIIERKEDGLVLADGTGTIEVEWAGTLPPVGTSRVFVHGFVRGKVIQIGEILRFEDVRVAATSVDIWPI